MYTIALKKKNACIYEYSMRRKNDQESKEKKRKRGR